MPMSQVIVYLRHTLTEEQVYEYFLISAFLIAFRWAFLISIKGNCLFMSLVKGASL
jgi:hypothetical protein